MAEVEDVARAAARPGRARAARAACSSSRGASSELGSRLPMHAPRRRARPRSRRARTRKSMPITSPPASAHERVERRVARAEVDHAARSCSSAANSRCHVRLHVARVVGRAERADPAVEDLQRLRARLDLRVAGSRRPRRSASPSARSRRLGVAVHQRLGVQVVARAAALDHVRGQREGRARKADQRDACRRAPRARCASVCIT